MRTSLRHLGTGLLFGMILSVPTLGNSQSYIPNDGDAEIIRAELAKQMLDPESTIVSDIMATDETTDDGQSMTWVCGKVRGKNTFGGYAQPVPFMGALLETPKSGRAFIAIAVAEPNNASQLAVLQTCLAKFEENTDSSKP